MRTEEAPQQAVAVHLGGWVSGLEIRHVPDAVVSHLKLCLLDALGCGIFGSRQTWGRAVADVARAFSDGGPSTLIGSPDSACPSDAAMANGTAMHGFELDDAHTASSLHPGAVVVPAALAVAEEEGLSGSEFLAAMAAGYEVGLRIGICAGIGHSTSGFHVTGTVGSFAASAAAARALRLNAGSVAHAISIGGTQASGLYCARFGAMTKRFHAGRAAQSGVLGAYLARGGFTGALDILEARSGGFLTAFRGDGQAETILDGLGEKWESAKVGFKLHCACASAHTTIDAVLAMRKKGLRPERLRKLTVSLSRKGFHNIGWPYKPADVTSAQMNGSYAAAVALLDGQVFVEQYAEPRLGSRQILELIGRIAFRHEPDLDAGGPAARHTAVVVAELVDGSVMRETIAHRTGSAEHPLGRDALERKFRTLAVYAGIADRDAERIVELAAGLERVETLSTLTATLRSAFGPRDAVNACGH